MATTKGTEQEVNVSLEDHLLESLKVILPVLPEDIGQSLEKYVLKPSLYIPYSILTTISKWSRTDEGRATLGAKDLDPASYTTVALLAGTLTSPERKFGHYVPPKDADVVAVERARERKAITALANSVLSVTGVGVGAFWASERTGWRDEWRALFALFSATVVAIAEAGLFLIWQWRSADPTTKTQQKPAAQDKKVDPALETNEVPNDPTLDEKKTLRRRRK